MIANFNIRKVSFMLSFITMMPCAFSIAQTTASKPMIDPKPFTDDANHWYNIFDKHNVINPLPDKPRYQPTDIIPIGDNILLFQKANGGWAKNYDVMAILTPSQKDSLINTKQELNTTFDNGSTYTQIQALAIVYNVTKQEKYKTAIIKGLDYICEAQYGNGGWPQYYPLEKNYSSHITFNDDAYLGIMELLQSIHNRDSLYQFIDTSLQAKLDEAYNKGLDCIIKTQINDAGTPTAWCQQYDEKTLQPAWARKFEPPSICNKESAGLVIFLMKIKNPSKEIKQSIVNAIAWFRESAIYNTRVVTFSAPDTVTSFRVSKTDRKVVADSSAPKIWTRYYELKTHKPMFCDRDSKIVYSLAEVSRERRDGYAWYTYEPQKALDIYEGWIKKQ